MVVEATLWCPSCGAEYEATASQCADCRVALVTERPAFIDDEADDSGWSSSASGLECRPKCCAAGSRPRASR